jgi:hypothetical protein
MIDLEKLAMVMQSVGLDVFYRPAGGHLEEYLDLGHLFDYVPTFWRGDCEFGDLTLILRDAVRKVAPGSFCFPSPYKDEGMSMTVRILEEYGTALKQPDGHPARIRPYGFIPTETEAWAKALIALHENGLLPAVPHTLKESAAND